MNVPFSIHKAEITDAVALSALILNNAKYFLKPHYSEQQWGVFEQYYSIETLQEKIQNQKVFCAKQNGNIVGTIALDHDYIVGFYTHVDFANKGIGSKLLRYIEEEAKASRLSVLFLASSPVGVDFYLKYGWQVVSALAIDYLGVSFVETVMKKQLSDEN
ncbi:GNAT family N-acetyltransferase [Flavobacterium sp. TSSA_36]|uniref:GNAT family N-acetyltransferase n=1 Tax=Flavobacterium sp. TSSA_36 TaxID=3447669 RepID=UPI003F2AEB80